MSLVAPPPPCGCCGVNYGCAQMVGLTGISRGREVIGRSWQAEEGRRRPIIPAMAAFLGGGSQDIAPHSSFFATPFLSDNFSSYALIVFLFPYAPIQI